MYRTIRKSSHNFCLESLSPVVCVFLPSTSLGIACGMFHLVCHTKHESRDVQSTMVIIKSFV